MRFVRMLLVIVLVAPSFVPRQVLAQKPKKAASVAPAEPLQDGWEEIDKRLIFLMVRLANTEASLDAVEKRVGSGTRQRAAKAGEAKLAEANNERMDRKGGGPVKWSEFYGRTAEKFFYHPVDQNTSYHTLTVLGQKSPQADNRSGEGVPSRQGLPVHQRPPQFDYIYKANSDAKARAESEASALRNKVDALIARRRQLEDEQAALWCQIAFRAVSRFDLPKKPLYRFETVATNPDTESRNHAEAVKAAAIFMRRALSIVEVADKDQAKAFGSVKTVVTDACDKLDDAWLPLNVVPDNTPDLKTSAGRFSALTKRLKDVSENLSDSYEVSIDGDRYKDELRKDTFRGLLQESLVDYAQIVLALNEMSSSMASEWKAKPDLNTPLKFVSLEIPARAASLSGTNTTIPAEVPPAPTTQLASVLPGGRFQIKYSNRFSRTVTISGTQCRVNSHGWNGVEDKQSYAGTFGILPTGDFDIRLGDQYEVWHITPERIVISHWMAGANRTLPATISGYATRTGDSQSDQTRDKTTQKQGKQKIGVTDDLHPVAIYRHIVPGLADSKLTLLSDGTVQGRYATWRLTGRTLVLDWARPNDTRWHDELRLSGDGLSYYGKNQSGAVIRGDAVELSRDWHKMIDQRR